MSVGVEEPVSERRVAVTPRFSRVMQVLSKSFTWVCCKVWFRLRCHGGEHVPDSGPVLIVANHASFLDPVVVGLGVRRWVHFVARSSLARFEPMGWWMRHMETILIDRDAPSKQVLRDLVAALEGGRCVCLFPEGTRSADGSVGAFRGGVEFLARKTGSAVVPAGIEGTGRAFPRGARFPRPLPVVVRYGRPWTAAEVLAPGGLERLREEVVNLVERPEVGTGSP